MAKITSVDEAIIYHLAGINQRLEYLLLNQVLGDSYITQYQFSLQVNKLTKIAECSGRQKAKILRIKNLDFVENRILYIGNESLTSQNGYVIYPNEPEEIILFNGLSLYALVITGTNPLIISILERG